MTVEEVKNHFGTGYNFQKQTGMSHSQITNWEGIGHVPIQSQIKLQRLTNGALKANIKHLGDRC